MPLILPDEQLLRRLLDLSGMRDEASENGAADIDALLSALRARLPESAADDFARLCAMVKRYNDPRCWSVCRFIGSERAVRAQARLTCGRCYYWPCDRDAPAYMGVLDDIEDVPAALPPLPALWRIERDPTGMACRALYPGQDAAWTLQVLYLRPVPPLQYTPGGDWIDLCCAQETALRVGESARIPLGVAIRLPEGCEAHVLPRSSTFSRYGVVQSNGMGVVDESYCGKTDEWMLPVYAVRDTVIPFGARICQFRAMVKMPPVRFVTVTDLSAPPRGGFGSTGE